MGAEKKVEHRFKKGQSGNPGGRKKMPQNLKGIAALSGEEVRLTIAKYCRMTRQQLQDALLGSTTAMLELNIASGLAKGARTGDLSKLAYLLERTIGKIKEEVTVNSIDLTEYRHVSNESLKAIIAKSDD